MWIRRLLTLPLWLAVAFCAVLFITVPMDLSQQSILGVGMILSVLLLNRKKSRRATLVIVVIAMLVSTRYIFWRTTHTLSFDTTVEMVLGGGLYLAELYAWVIMALGFLQTSWPLKRPVVEIQGEPETWPMVDVYIPTYNESLEIVRNTVYAAMDMDYPADKFRVFILDDGRREEFREFARQADCGYLTRSDNLHAKAGNLNAALKKTDGELIVVFDCDHVPTRAFLQLTVGWFQRDPKLALLQTPHHFYSPDPVQRNLGTVEDLPGEGDLFYGAVQSGNDLWNATFFCGSCAIIRREALMQTNGFAGETVTEDAHTALKLQRMGWNTAYIGARLSAGLATERLVLHIGQRVRWARGMTQIFRIDNPLFGPGLTWQQRLCYLNAMMHFQFPLPRIVFLTAPLAFLIGGQNIIHASAALIFAYALPHLFISTISTERIHGGDRRPFWGEIYETLLAFHLVKPTVFTLFQPRKGKFNVTDKGGLLDRTHFDLATVQPHMFVIGLIIFGIILGLAKLLFFSHLIEIDTGTFILNLSWGMFSLLILLAAVSVARESRQIRESVRMQVHVPVTLFLDDGYVVDCRTIDFSMGGVAADLPEGVDLTGRDVTSLSIPMGDETLTLPVDIVRTDRGVARMRFEPLDQLQQRQLVRAIMGRADAWESSEKPAPVSGFRSLADIARVDLTTLKRILRPSMKRVPISIAALAIVSTIGSLVVASPAFAQEKPSDEVSDEAVSSDDGIHEQRITLEDLSVSSPIRLAGTRGEIGIPFGLREDEVVVDAKMTVELSYSPALLGDLSQLVVLLNGEVVHIMQLQPDGADRVRLQLDVEPALFLSGDNQLNFRFLGHYARDCEDPFHSSLWMNISNERSYFDLTVQKLQTPPDLSKLPAPFFDTNDPKALELPFVISEDPSNGELEAAGTVASWFGSLASYRGFSFPVLFDELPEGNAVVFLEEGESLEGVTASMAGPAISVVKNPRDPFGKLLIVSGANTEDLKLAAAGLAYSSSLVSGKAASMDSVRVPSFERYGAPRWLPTDRKVPFSEIAEDYSLEGRGLPPGPLTARFRVSPDLFFWPRDGARVNLDYRYPSAPWLDKASSRLDISLNAQYLRTLPLRGQSMLSRFMNGEDTMSRDRSAKVSLPRYNLFGENELVFDYNLVLADKRECVGTLPDNVRVSVLPESTIDLTGTHHAKKMPDLSAFAGAGYPFTIRPDLAETVVLLPAAPDVATVETFLAVMGRFGDSTGAATARAIVSRETSSRSLRQKDILVIGPLELAQAQSLFSDSPVAYENGRLHVPKRTLADNIGGAIIGQQRDTVDEANETLFAAEHFTGMISFQSPFKEQRSVVALLASDTDELPKMVAAFDDVDVIADVQGDLSIVEGKGMASFAVGQSYWISDLPWWLSIAYWLSARPLVLLLGCILVAIFVTAPIYAFLKRQESRRLGDTES